MECPLPLRSSIRNRFVAPGGQAPHRLEFGALPDPSGLGGLLLGGSLDSSCEKVAAEARIGDEQLVPGLDRPEFVEDIRVGDVLVLLYALAIHRNPPAVLILVVLAMSGVVDQHMIIWPGGLLQPVDAVEHLDAGCVSQQPDLMRGIAVLACQQGGQSLCIMHSGLQRGPVQVFVVADDERTVTGLAGSFFSNR